MCSSDLPEDSVQTAAKGGWDWKGVLGFKKGMPFGDKIIFGFAYGYLVINLLIIVVVTLWNALFGTTDNMWLTFWHVFIWLNLILTIVIIVWFAIGGLRDLKDLFDKLRTIKRDERDDGTVIDHHNIGEDG